ncbi:MAG: DUF1295 domain-containing protein [Candidatus Gracilibacteria bacterium]|nr:DUF1295 domain-containing protein [Candidatus Gracilibacteria bacterium]MCP4524093.1 DUF1295 domain-containing protein [Candidatus Gracilibacteria bacterium]
MIEVLITLSLCYILLFIISIKIQDNSIVDVFWGVGFLIVTLVLVHKNGLHDFSEILILFLIIIWSFRISISILLKKIKQKGEDKRYSKWRKEWRYFYTRSFFQVYLLQMFLLILVSIPIFIIFYSKGDNNLLNIAGLFTSFFGLVYETIADIQISNFIKGKDKNLNKIFTKGLWKYSRHPNYFGELIFWIGICIISLQYSLYGIIGLLVIAFILLFVSGVPLKERYYKNKSNYNEYVNNTPLFIPNYKSK